MNSSRNELAAAHEKIAQLEERVAYLKKKPPPRVPFSLRGFAPPGPAGWMVMVALVAVCGGFTVQIFVRAKALSAAAEVDTSFKGIATAPANTSDVIPPVVDRGAVASSSSKTKWKPNAKCNCASGDPWCGCP